MTVNKQICKCGNHEVEISSEIMILENRPEEAASNLLINAKIILKNYRFNVHFQVGREEWHFQQFSDPKEVAVFCRNNLRLNQIYKIFHQISACVDGRAETVARQINLHICWQMVNDKNSFQENNIQTACKLISKLLNSAHAAHWKKPAKTKIETEH